ncbi:unnamed protein product [Allacma fusca]|uniref:Uncharacterized protein n=1 Tax=Allacma fusca TaxID=39272 RepID=A0A8J2JFP1_9HEXA|nr:unnamed protein product [Allacma fusca]
MVAGIFLHRQFPKVTSLTFTCSKFDPSTATVGDIFVTFPKLTKLSLNGRCEFKDFSGMANARIAKFAERGKPSKNVPREKSITDFMELETIVFGSSFVVDPNMVRYCLPRVPKLREVSLHWNESLSASLLRDFIGHLERITILNTDCAYGGFEDAMAQVAEMLPNACIK